ncbi:MAG: hypothetical protein H7Y86_06195, partial [Rhizobacter sp.]|nr:hypothetical protein [Ferruginibacter sp.]
MKTISVLLFSLLSFGLYAQNIGIGSPNPQKKLTVNGSILLDENNTNDGGIDSAALLFGTSGNVGIASKKTSAGWQNGMSFFTNAQNRMTLGANGFLGINTNLPSYPLHVNGVIRGNTDIWATGLGRFDGRLAIGSAGLPEYKLHNNGNSFLGGNVNVTGTTALSGILNVAGYTTIDDNARVNGHLGIGGPASGFYGLHVQSAQAGFDGNLTVDETAFLGDLQVNRDGIINGNARVNGRIGINGATHGSYGLMVNNANSYFEGNATVQGNTNLQGNVTIQGNGHVRSNGNSSLRMGFESVSVTGSWNGKQERNFTINLPDFGTNIENIRVSVAQFDPEDWVTTTSDFKWYIYNVNHNTGTAQLRVINESSGLREFFGIFYIL